MFYEDIIFNTSVPIKLHGNKIGNVRNNFFMEM
jgi:hypothetical protein